MAKRNMICLTAVSLFLIFSTTAHSEFIAEDPDCAFLNTQIFQELTGHRC